MQGLFGLGVGLAVGWLGGLKWKLDQGRISQQAHVDSPAKLLKAEEHAPLERMYANGEVIDTSTSPLVTKDDKGGALLVSGERLPARRLEGSFGPGLLSRDVLAKSESIDQAQSRAASLLTGKALLKLDSLSEEVGTSGDNHAGSGGISSQEVKEREEGGSNQANGPVSQQDIESSTSFGDTSSLENRISDGGAGEPTAKAADARLRSPARRLLAGSKSGLPSSSSKWDAGSLSFKRPLLTANVPQVGSSSNGLNSPEAAPVTQLSTEPVVQNPAPESVTGSQDSAALQVAHTPNLQSDRPESADTANIVPGPDQLMSKSSELSIQDLVDIPLDEDREVPAAAGNVTQGAERSRLDTLEEQEQEQETSISSDPSQDPPPQVELMPRSDHIRSADVTPPELLNLNGTRQSRPDLVQDNNGFAGVVASVLAQTKAQPVERPSAEPVPTEQTALYSIITKEQWAILLELGSLAEKEKAVEKLAQLNEDGWEDLQDRVDQICRCAAGLLANPEKPKAVASKWLKLRSAVKTQEKEGASSAACANAVVVLERTLRDELCRDDVLTPEMLASLMGVLAESSNPESVLTCGLDVLNRSLHVGTRTLRAAVALAISRVGAKGFKNLKGGNSKSWSDLVNRAVGCSLAFVKDESEVVRGIAMQALGNFVQEGSVIGM